MRPQIKEEAVCVFAGTPARMVVACLAAALAVVLLAGPVRAQVATGAIVGTVTDPTGAAVPSATVMIKNAGTGITQSVKTGATGNYSFNLLQLGTYSVTVQATGFRTFQAAGVTLSPGARVRVNVALALGAQSQTVRVSASSVPLLQTDTSVVGTNLSSEKIQNLPIQGRNYMNLVTLSAGVTTGLPGALSSGQRPDDRRQTAAYAANGLSDIGNSNMIDGFDNNERFIGSIGVRPAPSAIAQVKVMTNQYTAAVGRTAGGVVDLVTKSGTNQLHGDLYEYFGNNIFDARDYFASTTPELRLNQFGGSLGGPIIKNKTFFFGDYEGYYLNNGLAVTSTVPTLFEEQHPGNFSDIGGPVIPSGEITPLGLALFKLFPAPTPGIPANAGYNFAAAPVRTQKASTYDARIDEHLSDKNSFFVRYTFNGTNTVTPDNFPLVSETGPSGSLSVNPGASSGANSFPGQALERQQAVAIVFSHVVSPTLLYQLRAGYMRSAINSNSANTGVPVATAIGFPCNSTSCINVPGVLTDTGLPRINFPGTPYATLGDFPFIPLVTIDNDIQYEASLSWTPGAQTIQIGIGLIRRQLAENQSSFPRGSFDFRGIYTGNALGDLLTGQATDESRSNFLVQPQYRAWEPSAYFEDDWHALKWLTLNLGIRYDIYTPLTTKHGEFANFDTATGLLVSPSLPGNQNSSSTADVQTDFGDVAPRIGFAANLGHSLVLRGGFGISYWPDGFGTPLVMRNAPFNFSTGCGVAPFSTTPCTGPYALSNGGGVLAAGLPRPVLDISLATNPANYHGTSISSTAFNFPSAYVDQFNLELQKVYAGNRFTIGYVGNLGRRLAMGVPINQPVTNVAPYPIPSLPGVGISQLQSAAESNYNAMQTTFVHQFNHGISASLNWTWAHIITNGGVPSEAGPPTPCSFKGCLEDNPSNPSQPIVVNGWQQYSRGNGALDVRHHIAGTLVWNLPFGNNLKSVAAEAIKGWTVDATYFWQSGLPFTVTNARAFSGIPGLGSDPPDMIASPVLPNPTIQAWFNVAAFKQQTPGTLGNERPFQVFGPPSRQFNLALTKNFSLTERYTLQFRAETYNLSNTPNFANPGSGIHAYNSSGVATNAGGFGAITSTAPGSLPRQMQFALKLQF